MAARLVLSTLLVSPEDSLLDEVKALGRRNSRTLGYLPTGAFADYAAKGQVLAVSRGRSLAGYLLYRWRSRAGSVAIVHLCVHEDHRGQGVARRLIDELNRRTEHAAGVGLWCRRDFAASKVWPRFGFVARAERPGRAGTLVYWWLRHEGAPQLDLLWSQEEGRTEALSVAIDASVFFDLVNQQDSEADTSESQVLVSDWIQPYVEICVTAELLNEIVRAESRDRRKQARRRASSFRELPVEENRFSEAFRLLGNILPASGHESDRRQLARAVSGGADLFATRDTDLLDRADSIEERVQLPVVSPTGLVLRLDSLMRAHEYQPSRLGGSRFSVSRATESEVTSILQSFLQTGLAERKTMLRRRLRQHQQDLSAGQVEVIRDGSGAAVALLGFKHRCAGQVSEIDVGLLRVSLAGQLAPTLARALVDRIVAIGLARSCVASVVTDPRMPAEVIGALDEAGFRHLDEAWLKVHDRRVDTASGISSWLTEAFASTRVARLATEIGKSIAVAAESKSSEALLAAEGLVWPTKFSDLEVPCYVVPIRPVWAMHLFDEDLAAGDLFGADEALAFNTENVYYRAPRPGRPKVPSRILWYVSRDPRFPGSGAIRAMSMLDEVEIGAPKELFRRFQRLGVYEWRDVFKLAKNDVTTPVMAIRFSRTERFSEPIAFDRCQALLDLNGARGNQFQSVTAVPKGFFMDAYRRGVLGEEENQ